MKINHPVHTDLAPLRECRIENISLVPLSRITMNQILPEKEFAPLAVAGTVFSCAAAVRHRLPITGLHLDVGGMIPGHAHPVLNVVFPERAALIPDIVSNDDKIDVAGNTAAMFLLKFDLPRNLQPGQYEITITAKSASHRQAVRKFTLDVLPAMPVSADSPKTVFWPHWETFCRCLKLELWSEEFWAAAELYLKEMADGGMNVIMASIHHDPFRYPLPPEYHCFNHYPSMIRWRKNTYGQWSFDYSVYDRYVELNMRLGIDREIECHSLLPCKRQHPVLGYFDGNGIFVEQPTAYDSPEYRNAWSTFLHDFIAHNRLRGWADRLTICPYDEPDAPDSFRSVALLAKSIAPEIRISAAITAAKASELVDVIDIATVHLSSGFDAEAVSVLRRAGVEVRWYNCCRPEGWGNTLFACELADSYRIGWMTAAGGFSGFLRWSIIDWPPQVLVNPGFNWPTGDTHLLYPGANGPLESLRWHAYKQGQRDLRISRNIVPDELLMEIGAVQPGKGQPSPGELQQKLYRHLRKHSLKNRRKQSEVLMVE